MQHLKYPCAGQSEGPAGGKELTINNQDEKIQHHSMLIVLLPKKLPEAFFPGFPESRAIKKIPLIPYGGSENARPNHAQRASGDEQCGECAGRGEQPRQYLNPNF